MSRKRAHTGVCAPLKLDSACFTLFFLLLFGFTLFSRQGWFFFVISAMSNNLFGHGKPPFYKRVVGLKIQKISYLFKLPHLSLFLQRIINGVSLFFLGCTHLKS